MIKSLFIKATKNGLVMRELARLFEVRDSNLINDTEIFLKSHYSSFFSYSFKIFTYINCYYVYNDLIFGHICGRHKNIIFHDLL